MVVPAITLLLLLLPLAPAVWSRWHAAGITWGRKVESGSQLRAQLQLLMYSIAPSSAWSAWQGLVSPGGQGHPQQGPGAPHKGPQRH